MDVKIKYKVKKIKVVFFDIDDMFCVKDIGYMLLLILKVFKVLKDKGIVVGIVLGRVWYGVLKEV